MDSKQTKEREREGKGIEERVGKELDQSSRACNKGTWSLTIPLATSMAKITFGQQLWLKKAALGNSPHISPPLPCILVKSMSSSRVRV